ncbi:MULTISPECIES: DUF1329 domain-containing protein [Nitrospirillum]|uniref:Uncharacterized protein DUF1329 n=1 Tax=Nitrospirillum amazonense TaxID=28077 RepID=A0A560I2G0_9PROT|nr:DUF1329 domain-containing protein [Nitrospirillum amazonense]MDG3440829.1 DUF1329 domain-containing protein [Nitrospirillum amazonense]TWB52735.1 uncharacterized protein DUF1329 [Nitrospirillum amazonense]
MKWSNTALVGGAFAVFLGGMAGVAMAQSAADLGKTLTPNGAEKAGNKDGTIPEWTGGITAPPAGYKAGGVYVDPYASDKPLFTITGQNMAQYADKLPEGLKALLKQYPDYKMNVYPTHRSASLPKSVYDETLANATRAKLVDDGNGVEGAKVGVPFPVPKTGVEVVWNHILRWKGKQLERSYGAANPQADGSYTMININEKSKFLYSDTGPEGQTSLYFQQEVTAPARLAGEILLVHETMDQVKEPRNAWTYNPGQRRVRRAPNVAYDNPGTASDGLRTSDQLDVFNGSPDRYEWKLVGKKEMYVPYNAYQLQSDKLTYDQLIKAKHINQDYARYELHRVWVVEGKLKSGTSHIYPRRTFYVDEDSWGILVADQYDSRDQLWRVTEAHGINFYDVQTFWAGLFAVYDLQSGRYTASGFTNQEKPYNFNVNLTAADFSPDSLRRSGVR